MNRLPETLRTRTFWTSIITAIVLVLTAMDVITLDTEQLVATIVALVAMIFGNAWVEGVQVFKRNEYDVGYSHAEKDFAKFDYASETVAKLWDYISKNNLVYDFQYSTVADAAEKIIKRYYEREMDASKPMTDVYENDEEEVVGEALPEFRKSPRSP